jgi:hypothetical protein
MENRTEKNVIQLAADLGLPSPPPPNEQGDFLIELSESLKVFVRPLEPGLFLLGHIAPIPTNKKEEILCYVASGNFLHQGTGNYIIGIDDEEKFLTLSHTIPYEINYKIFKELIEDFVNFLSYWIKEIQKLQETAQKGIL